MRFSNSSLLWEITPPAQSNSSYLFGTMHVRDERVFAAMGQLTTYLYACEAFATEFDFAEIDALQFEQASKLPEGISLSAALSPSIYKRLEKVVLRELGQPLAIFEHCVPMLLLNLLAEAQLGKDNPIALDKALYNQALQADKKLVGLETFQEQLDVLQKFNLTAQYRTLKQVATNFARYRRTLQTMTHAYLQGDLKSLYQASKRSIGGMRRILLYERNQTMANRFEAYTKNQTLFAAVGAGHLAGYKGLLRLLKQKGYTIKPLPYHL